MSSTTPPSQPVFFFWNSSFQNNSLELVVQGTYPKRSILNLCQDRAFASFSCVLSLASVLGSHTCIVILANWGEVKPLPPPHTHFCHILNIYICCKYIIEGRGKSTAFQYFINFLGDIKVKICCLSPFV